MRKVIVLGSVALVTAAIACGGAAPPSASSPARESAPEPATVEEAQQQIADAKAALEGRSGEAKESADAKASTSSDKTPAAPGTQPKTVDKDHDGVPDSVDTKCVSPCRALASMRRAVTALCRMAGADDTRCTDAKKTLEASESKVATCGC